MKEPSQITVRDGVAYVELTGRVAREHGVAHVRIDECDIETLRTANVRRVSLVRTGCGRRAYARNASSHLKQFVHRLVAEAMLGRPVPYKLIVDHIDGDTLNCTRANLRPGAPVLNSCNRAKASMPTSSIYKGVYRNREAKQRPWVAQIAHGGHSYHLGNCPAEEFAAMLYDLYARRFFADGTAATNFPVRGERSAIGLPHSHFERKTSRVEMIDAETAQVDLGGGRYALIDQADAHWVRLALWRKYDGMSDCIRATVPGNRRFILNRLVANVTDPSMTVIHINGDRLDCRRCNLRVEPRHGGKHSPRSMSLSKRRSPQPSRFRGVCKHPDGRWIARLYDGKRQRSLGLFDDEVKAALAFDRAERERCEVLGIVARLNFPEPDELSALSPKSDTVSKKDDSGLSREGQEVHPVVDFAPAVG